MQGVKLTANSVKQLSDFLGTCSVFGALQARCYEAIHIGK
jgi:hypothetical protein